MTAAGRTIRPEGPLDLRATVGGLRVGAGDPTMRLDATTMVRATRTVDGPATLRVEVDDDATVRASAWGPGATRVLDAAPELLGMHDDRVGFEPGSHEIVARLDARRPGFRIGRTGRVVDVLLATILQQKVTGVEALRAFRHLVHVAGEPAPGPADGGLVLPPPADWLAHTPTWQYTAAGVDRTRAITIITAHRRIDRLEEAVGMTSDDARRRLTAIRGIGPWTAALVERHARGDPDAVEVGDFHLPNTVAWTLVREPRATDDRMLELLEPFRGHRGRVARLCELAGSTAPRRGPRHPIRSFGSRRRPGST